jgi:O-acetyl-ADP-ribose deacetylase (regulator of RNase III)
MDPALLIVVADITTLEVDALVNAANESLLGGGGVDGAIHRAAGPGLLEECRALSGCPTGEARVTGGHRLKARWVVHTVGPVWRGGDAGEDELLGRAYRAALEAARTVGARSIAIPCLSTGAFGFPKERAARLAIATVRAWLRANGNPLAVTLCAWTERDANVLRAAP